MFVDVNNTMEETKKRKTTLHKSSITSDKLGFETEDSLMYEQIISIEYIKTPNYGTSNKTLILKYSFPLDKFLYFLKWLVYFYVTKAIRKKIDEEKCKLNHLYRKESETNINTFSECKLLFDSADIKMYEEFDKCENVKDNIYGITMYQTSDQRQEKQDLLKSSSPEIETIDKSAIVNTEMLKPVNSFFKGAKVESVESEHISQTVVPAINEVDAVKQTLNLLEVTVLSSHVDLTESNKCGTVVHKKDEKNCTKSEDKAQLMEQLLSQKHFHFKESAYVVYMLPSQTCHPQAINGISWKNLKAEVWRLHTYSTYPHSAKKSAILLAEAGFAYYGTGSKDDHSVICYFCCVTKQSWKESDVISEIHKHLSPQCSMVTGVNCTNIPMRSPSDGETLFSKLYYVNNPNLNEGHRHKAINNGNDILTDCVPDDRTGEDSQLALAANSNNPAPVSKITAMENQAGRGASASVPPASQETARHPSSHPVPSDVQPAISNNNQLNVSNPSMAPNRTQAVTANQDIRNSSYESTTHISAGTSVQSSVPSRQQATTASVVINQSSQNPPPTVTSSPAITIQTSTTTTQGPQTGPAARGPTYGELGIITERPKRFEFAVRATRYATFDPWPRDHHLKKDDLADAGFYYAGYGDCARCFYCGGGLRNWEDDDNVWVEHARWFPKCAYIRQTMGQQFVDAVQDLNRNCDRITIQMVKEKMGNSTAFTHLDTMGTPLKRDPAVLTVLDLGYSENDVLIAATFIKDKNGTLSADSLFKKLVEDKKPRGASKQTIPEVQSSKRGPDEVKNEEAMKKLKEQNSQLRQQTVCKICMDKEVAVVFLPCGHFVSCTDCASAMKDCPVCRKPVRGIVRAFVG